MDEQDLIVSKTDTRGTITYANQTLIAISGFAEQELLGAPHSMLRHPDMPRAVFKLLWSELQAGREVFAYIVNLAKGGEHYWVLAHVTPTFGARNEILGFHSNRRCPKREACAAASRFYRELRDLEKSVADPHNGLQRSSALVAARIQERGVSWNQFVLSL